jgi:hypothetical protein
LDADSVGPRDLLFVFAVILALPRLPRCEAEGSEAEGLAERSKASVCHCTCPVTIRKGLRSCSILILLASSKISTQPVSDKPKSRPPASDTPCPIEIYRIARFLPELDSH